MSNSEASNLQDASIGVGKPKVVVGLDIPMATEEFLDGACAIRYARLHCCSGFFGVNDWDGIQVE
jgi:hypothetical protein